VRENSSSRQATRILS